MAVLDWLQQYLGGEPDQGAPMAVQNQQGGYDPYKPAPVPDALELLKSATGYTDLQQAGQAYQRGEYLPALGQGAWGAAQAATAALPVLRAGGAALKAGAPLAREAASALPAMMADQTGAIRAFHGSPHSFDRFDLSKIGTGEGAQAYGHGLYFAENEGVAKGYREALAGPPLMHLEPHKIKNELAGIGGFSPDSIPYARQALADYRGDVGETLKTLDQLALQQGNNRAKEAAQLIRAMQPSWATKTPGHMYEVDINADPKSFLDWDKPIGQQSAEVQERLRPGLAPYMTMQPMGTAVRQAGESPHAASLLFNREAKPLALTPDEVSERLRELGIPGSRYLDQGSRGAGTGTSNYSVFDPNLIEIRRKYGLLPPLVGGGLLATQGLPDDQ